MTNPNHDPECIFWKEVEWLEKNFGKKIYRYVSNSKFITIDAVVSKPDKPWNRYQLSIGPNGIALSLIPNMNIPHPCFWSRKKITLEDINDTLFVPFYVDIYEDPHPLYEDAKNTNDVGDVYKFAEKLDIFAENQALRNIIRDNYPVKVLGKLIADYI